jgi:hypothetical protein
MGPRCMFKNTSPNRSVDILKCQTESGRESLRQNRIALKAIERQTGFEFLGISNDEPSRIDGFVHDPSKGAIIGSYEIKTRYYGLSKLQTTFKNQWLISWSKIQAALEISRHSKLPLFGVLHLHEDNLVLMVEIFNSNASWAANHQIAEKIIDGRIERVALIDMNNAAKYRIHSGENQMSLFR